MNRARPTRETLLAYMGDPAYQPAKMKELARGMGVAQAGYRDFRRLVKELEIQGGVVRLRHNRYVLPETVRQVVGQLRVHPRGFGFVIAEGQPADLFVPRAALGQAIDGDWVRAEVTAGERGGRGPEGRIAEVVRQTPRRFIGTFLRKGRRPAVEPDDPALGRDIFLEGDAHQGVEEGKKVMVRVTARGWGFDGLRGEITEVLGDAGDPALDFLSVVNRFDLPVDFPLAVQQQVQELSLDIDGEANRRSDLRGLSCFTIDPVEARDFDDAVSLEPLPGRGYHLGVHIADVGHFVRPGTALDREAFKRGTSVYLVDQVVHMLPERLAGDLCTLKPEQDRLALSVMIELDEEGNVAGYEIAESIIRSTARFTYEQVQGSLDGDEDAAGPARRFASQLQLMQELRAKRREIRRRRGSLDFDLPEPRVVIDDRGQPTALGCYPRLESHQLIEEFMLVANECVGQHMAERQLPVLYRVHRAPDADKLERLADIVPSFTVEKGAELKPKDVQNWLAVIAARADGPLLTKLLLQAMMRAEYAAEDIGHFGLACRPYLHFTSPIRRYPDLLVHRVLKSHLVGELDDGYCQDLQHQMGWLGRWTSQCERRAEEAERTYVKIKQLRYLEGFVGEVFPGLVSGVLRGGFFVEVGDFMVDGFCFLRDLDDYFEFDADRHRLIGRRTRQIIQVGASVRVQIAGVDWNAQEMDLLLVDGDFSPPKKRGKKVAKKRKKGKDKRRRR